MTLSADKNNQDEQWMLAALQLAKRAADNNEVPVGAVVVYQGDIIGRGANGPIGSHDPTAHAEVMALRDAASYLKNYRLKDCNLYVTLEPCAMCIGAMLHARINRLVFGAFDPKSGMVVTKDQLLSSPWANHQISSQGGVLAEPCGQILQDFFRARRKARKSN